MRTFRFKLKNDQYRKARGGYSRFLNIYCSKCNSYLFLYQKDGSGELKRAYIDRVLAPKSLSSLQKINKIKDIPVLTCTNCGSVIGKPYIYKKEKRKSFLLSPSAFLKKIGKGFYTPKS